MRTAFGRFSQSDRRRTTDVGQLAVAGVLLVGVIVMAYGYLHETKIGLYLGLVLVVAGVLTGVVHILGRGNG